MLRKACENNFLRGFSTDEASAPDRQRRISPEHPKKKYRLACEYGRLSSLPVTGKVPGNGSNKKRLNA